MSTTARFKFRVTGSCEFPISMLHYDHCTPADARASHLITQSIRQNVGFAVDLISERGTEPTAALWRSAGWEVHPSFREPA